MTEMMEIYSCERDRLEKELALARDVKAATDSVCASMERMRLGYCSKVEDRRQRNEADRLFETARQSATLMLSVTGAGVNVLRDEQATATPRDKLIAMMPMTAMVIGAALTVWLILEEMSVPAALAVMLTAIAWLETQVVYKRRVAVAAFSKVNTSELLRLLDRLMESIDYALEISAQEANSAAIQSDAAQIQKS